MSAAFIPPAVQAEAGEITELLDLHQPEVEQVRTDTWRYTWDNGRVRVYVDLKGLQRGRVKWTGSKLWIDGEESPLAVSRAHFKRIWRGQSYEAALSDHDRGLLADLNKAQAQQDVASRAMGEFLSRNRGAIKNQGGRFTGRHHKI